MGSLNRVQIIGNVGRDPELRSTSGGQSVCSFSVACSESWKDKSGEKQERTEWVRVQMWGKLAEIAGEYLKKGKQVYLEGRLQTREWEDKDGQKRSTTEVVADKMVMLGDAPGKPPSMAAKPATKKAALEDMDNDIPF